MYGDELELYFSLTEVCNWQCFYCDFPLKQNPKSLKETGNNLWEKCLTTKHHSVV